MIFPYRTDAPLYHYPIGTGLLAVTCITVHVLRLIYQIPVETFALPLGKTITPINWLTCNFIHLDIMHLLVNVWFLWLFGLVVEGKVGFWRFMIIALGIGVGEAMSEQLLMLHTAITYSAGASVIIFGLMAMSLIWAPDNEVECLGEHYLSATSHFFQFDLTIYCFVGLYLIFSIIEIFHGGVRLSSAMLHMAGALIGMITATGMLYLRWVNCEGYDFFTRYAHLLNIPDAFLPESIVEDQTDDAQNEVTLGDKLIRP